MKPKNVLTYLVWLVIILVFAHGIYSAIELSWVCDDAFISFRYAVNLIDGHGLVFNVGEKVEGYTNFLWTILIALGMASGIDPSALTQVLGILSFAVTAVILGFLSWKLFHARARQAALFIPLSSLCLLLHRDYQVYATSGLETSWTAMLVCLGAALQILARRKGAYLVGGLVLILAGMSRPDAMIFYVVGIAYVLIAGEKKISSVIYYLLPLIILYLPYWIIRYNYYGYPFPNTYYAKSADLSYFKQGFLYLWLYFKTYYILFVMIPAIIWLTLKKPLIGRHMSDRIQRSILVSLLFIVPYVFYVVKTGGDFMFARFFIPITPVMFFLLETSLHKLIDNNGLRYFLAALIVITVSFRFDQYPSGGVREGISDERFYYPPEKTEAARETGLKIREYLADTDYTVAFYGAHAMYVYYAGVPVAIESDAGLTDEYIAHLPLPRRGRVGHEKHAPVEYLYERKVNFVFKTSLPSVSTWDRLRVITFGDYRAFVFIYENEVMEKLKQYDDVKFTDFPEFLDEYIAEMADYPDAKVREDYNFFRFYYFAHNRDPERERPFHERM
ncbi:MAG: hypothetical protein JSU69_01595 [Candidatus Zixiibacteriota bacterium]|nr:MAG: hypothetical protein JSU69_01595 [candidate division Zixibacteria bacterium]